MLLYFVYMYHVGIPCAKAGWRINTKPVINALESLQGVLYIFFTELHTLLWLYVWNTKLRETFPKTDETGISNCLLLPSTTGHQAAFCESRNISFCYGCCSASLTRSPRQWGACSIPAGPVQHTAVLHPYTRKSQKNVFTQHTWSKISSFYLFKLQFNRFGVCCCYSFSNFLADLKRLLLGGSFQEYKHATRDQT